MSDQRERFDNFPPKQHPAVRGRCPSCGAESLFLGSGGYVTCSVIGCKDPGAATDLLAWPSGEARPAPPAGDAESVEIIVNGQPVQVAAGPIRKVIAAAIERAHQIGAPLDQWVLRTRDGELIPHALPGGVEYALCGGQRLFLHLGVPCGEVRPAPPAGWITADSRDELLAKLGPCAPVAKELMRRMEAAPPVGDAGTPDAARMEAAYRDGYTDGWCDRAPEPTSLEAMQAACTSGWRQSESCNCLQSRAREDPLRCRRREASRDAVGGQRPDGEVGAEMRTAE